MPLAPACWASPPAIPSLRSAMALAEINFDGVVGPSHNYAGLSFGNLAAMVSEGRPAQPRAAALQCVEKMRRNLGLALVQGIPLPHRRPDRDWLAALGT